MKTLNSYQERPWKTPVRDASVFRAYVNLPDIPGWQWGIFFDDPYLSHKEKGNELFGWITAPSERNQFPGWQMRLHSPKITDQTHGRYIVINELRTAQDAIDALCNHIYLGLY